MAYDYETDLSEIAAQSAVESGVTNWATTVICSLCGRPVSIEKVRVDYNGLRVCKDHSGDKQPKNTKRKRLYPSNVMRRVRWLKAKRQ